MLREGRCWCEVGEVGLGRLDSRGVRWARWSADERVGASGEVWRVGSAWLRWWPLSCGNTGCLGTGAGIGGGWGAEGMVFRAGGRYWYALFLLSICRLPMSVTAGIIP